MKRMWQISLLYVVVCQSAVADDWASYLGDEARTHFSPLMQIDKSNVAELTEAWRFTTHDARAGSVIHTSPLVIDGVLYGLSPKSVVFALNAATGDELWRYAPPASAPQRGLMWWGEGEDARLLLFAGRHLIALNPASGTPIEDFGVHGIVDVHPFDGDGFYSVSTPGAIFEDLLIHGARVGESEGSLPGSIVARSVLTGKVVWEFVTINGAGGANNWAGMALDAERGLVFAPTGSATPDFFGDDRPGNNLYANCLLALDARTGQLRWHFQFVRHDLWDRDPPAPPTLVQAKHEGVIVDAVAQTTKSGELWLFDRETGQILHDVIEVAASPSTLEGELAAGSQPVSPIRFTRSTFEAKNRAVEAAVAPLNKTPFAPPSLEGSLLYPAFDGGAEWGGSAYRHQPRQLFVNAQEGGGIVRMYEIPKDHDAKREYARHCGACHGVDLKGTDAGPGLVDVADRLSINEIFAVVVNGSGRMPGFSGLSHLELTSAVGVVLGREPEVERKRSTRQEYGFAGYQKILDDQGLPGNTPPWGTLSAIDLDEQEVAWQVPLGDYPSQHGKGFGAESYGGPVVTASGVLFIAATPDAMIRAFDADDGSLLWEAELPAAGYATPAVYAAGGRQFVVVAAGGGKLGTPSGSSYVAFTLPDPSTRDPGS